MLSAVRPQWITMLAGVIAAVVLVSVVIGLTSPDGASATTTRPSRRRPRRPRRPARLPRRPRRRPNQQDRSRPGRRVRRRSMARASRRGHGHWHVGGLVPRRAYDWGRRGRGRVRQGRGPRCRVRRRDVRLRQAFLQARDPPRLVCPEGSRLRAAGARAVDGRCVPCPHQPVRRPSRQRRRARRLGLVVLRGEGTRQTPSTPRRATATLLRQGVPTSGYRDWAASVNPTWSKVAMSVDRSKAEPGSSRLSTHRLRCRSSTPPNGATTC